VALDPDAFLTDWHRIVAERDLDGLRARLAEDVSLGAPPYWTRIEGREVVHHLLDLILETIEDFTYHREWREGAELALEFRGRVGDLDLQGIDLITLDERSRVANIDVLMRPAAAIAALRDVIAPKMTAFLSARST